MILGLGMTLAACGGGSDGGTNDGSNDTSAGGMSGVAGAAGASTTTGPGAAITLQQYCDKVIALEKPWCDYLDKCCSAADKADLDFMPPACRTGLSSASECVSSFQKSLDGGNVVFDGTWADNCIAAVAKNQPPSPTSCSGLHAFDNEGKGHGWAARDQVPECRKLFAGKLAKGATCETTSECGAGLICSTGTSSAVGTYTCLPAGTTGAHCFSRGDCAAGLACVGTVDYRHCGPLGTEGDKCIYGDDCADGLVCNLTCVKPKLLGQTCSFEDICAGLAGCDFTLNECVSVKPDGAACSSSGQCQGRCDSTTMKCTSICGGTLLPAASTVVTR